MLGGLTSFFNLMTSWATCRVVEVTWAISLIEPLRYLGHVAFRDNSERIFKNPFECKLSYRDRDVELSC